MLIPNHPQDERLSALASGDPEAVAEATLSAHVAECQRCAAVVDDLRVLTSSLAALPDLRPHRPLRLLPEVVEAPSRADRLGGWARRFFAPALTAGAALAMVGLVGTTAPALNGMAASGGAAPEELSAQDAGAGDGGGGAAQSAAPGAAGAESAPSADAYAGAVDAASPTSGRLSLDGDDTENAARATDQPTAMTAQPSPADGSPWPIVLVSGLAVMLAAALLRWVLVPRAG